MSNVVQPTIRTPNGEELEIEKIVLVPITRRTIGHTDRIMWVAHVYSAVYDKPVFTTDPMLSPSGAVLRAFTRVTIEWRMPA